MLEVMLIDFLMYQTLSRLKKNFKRAEFGSFINSVTNMSSRIQECHFMSFKFNSSKTFTSNEIFLNLDNETLIDTTDVLQSNVPCYMLQQATAHLNPE